MADEAQIRTATERLVAQFEASGAVRVGADILQPAGPLLDLYGEDIRARAFITADPLVGEMMLRPDFTLPVVQMHLAGGQGPGRYTYAGPVFRQQENETGRPREYVQVGYERFGETNRAAADAAVFATFHKLLAPLGLRPAMGDIGLLIAAIQGLSTTDARKAALLRHLWRPRRFRALIARFGALQPARQVETGGPEIGLRSKAEVNARLVALAEDAKAPPLTELEADVLDRLLLLKGAASDVLSELNDIAVDFPALAAAAGSLDARLKAFAAAGLDVETLPFEASYGRTSLEYYDGFVFGFYAEGRPDLPAVATGGRYDALTAELGEAIPAVGGVIRPGILAELGLTP